LGAPDHREKESVELTGNAGRSAARGLTRRAVSRRQRRSRMPNRAVVADFIATIERGEFLAALSFYAEDMTAQENNAPPRIGKAAQQANEEAALKRMQFVTNKAVSYLVDGDRVAIHYLFEMTTVEGGRLRMEEIAFQVWRGDQIVSERYFYDPAQRLPIQPT
jgi:ketosteroid isomerase-like protein